MGLERGGAGSRPPVDAVVMWVDGDDPAFVASRAEHLKAVASSDSARKDGPGRHRDNGELRYMLRALDANLPWIRRVFIITNGQVPPFVDFSSNRVELVSHGQIFPDPSHLPSFNSFAIESCLHRIPGLSEHFVRFSDDFFVCRPVDQEAILASDNLGIIRLGSRIMLPDKATKLYDQLLANNAGRLFQEYGFYPRHNFLHVPQLRVRSICDALIDRWSDGYSATRSHRFREVGDCITLFLYPYFVLAEYRRARMSLTTGRIDHEHVEYPWSAGYRQVQVGSKASDWRSRLEDVLRHPPQFLNLNDAFGPSPLEEDSLHYRRFLEAMFPTPSTFERTSEHAT